MYQLASHGLNFDEVYNIIENRFLDICRDLKLGIEIGKILDEIKEQIKDGASKDYCGSRGEYLNGIILSEYLGFQFIDSQEIILFDENGQFDEKGTEQRLGSLKRSVLCCDSRILWK